MKFVIAALAVLASSAASAVPTTVEGAVLNAPVITSTYTLLNSANGNSCKAPVAADVQVYCFGALPTVTSPTIVREGCAFSLTLTCTNGAAATISGSDVAFSVIDQTGKSIDHAALGIYLDRIDLTPAR